MTLETCNELWNRVQVLKLQELTTWTPDGHIKLSDIPSMITDLSKIINNIFDTQEIAQAQHDLVQALAELPVDDYRIWLTEEVTRAQQNAKEQQAVIGPKLLKLLF